MSLQEHKEIEILLDKGGQWRLVVRKSPSAEYNLGWGSPEKQAKNLAAMDKETLAQITELLKRAFHAGRMYQSKALRQIINYQAPYAPSQLGEEFLLRESGS